MPEYSFFDRDISWLSFNERVLMEAAADRVPLAERLKFLSIYSSNLDEFYRVRVPSLMALAKLSKEGKKANTAHYSKLLDEIKGIVSKQLSTFGQLLTGILPRLKEKSVHIIYNEPVPEFIKEPVSDYFFNQVLGYLQPVDIEKNTSFFSENNKLYALAVLRKGTEEILRVINIPTEQVPRFFSITRNDKQYIIFLEDIIKDNLHKIFDEYEVTGVYNFKITRDAELELQDEYEDDLVEKMEKQIAKRDFGFATRFLYNASMPIRFLPPLISMFNLQNANIVEGGTYHNLKDFASIPVTDPSLFYDKWPSFQVRPMNNCNSLLEHIAKKDMILHPPYHAYDMVLRFFNEAANDEYVEEIYVTLYRVAQQSKITNALISAARNGKKVTVLMELKARFDESNNIKWAKKMKAAGIKIHYSPTSLKVHAKVALVKKRQAGKLIYFGLLATGNLNEVTARFYTDHILLTSHNELLRELEVLFLQLGSKNPLENEKNTRFQHLLVAQFNLKRKFIQLIDEEISNAKQGKPAAITIKLNNLEEKTLIGRLYEASKAGVTINLLVRGICCLVPGIKGMSENISVKRIIDRYLEHGRIFIFYNNGQPKVVLGSADWMNRNIHRRIEVCFPVYDEQIKNEIISMVDIQLQDNTQAAPPVHSQKEIYRKLSGA